jgi:collagen type XIV alpha
MQSLPAYYGLSFCFITGGKTNQMNLQNTATKAIIQGLLPEQNYTVQLIAYYKDKESKPAQGQFRSMY